MTATPHISRHTGAEGVYRLCMHLTSVARRPVPCWSGTGAPLLSASLPMFVVWLSGLRAGEEGVASSSLREALAHSTLCCVASGAMADTTATCLPTSKWGCSGSAMVIVLAGTPSGASSTLQRFEGVRLLETCAKEPSAQCARGCYVVKGLSGRGWDWWGDCKHLGCGVGLLHRGSAVVVYAPISRL